MSADLQAAAEDIRRGGPGGSVWEVLYGQSFLSLAPTPFLAEAQRRVAAALEEAGARIEVQSPLVIAERHLLVPDVAVRDGEGRVVLVVELRSDSTERYALGIKRLLYAVDGIAEYWFVEPRERNLHRLQLVDRVHGYGWPPRLLRDGEAVDLGALGLGRVAVTDLLP